MSKVMKFDDYPRKVYKRTFLNTVFVVFSYSIEEISADLLTSVNQFLRDYFNTQENVTEEIFRHGFSFDNSEKGIFYFFSAKHLGIKYLKDDYVSFQQTMMPLIYPLMAYLKNVVNIDVLSDLSIRKVNLWTVKRQIEESLDENQFINDFLSKELISHAQELGIGEDLRDAHAFIGESGSFDFSLQYGFVDSEHNGDKYCGLVLDESVSTKDIQISNAESELLEVNNVLYNIFHWSVSKRTLAYMDKEI